jgi:hypothetical protein
MLYHNKSEFKLSFTVTGGQADAGRDFLFAGRSEITERCGGRPTHHEAFDCAAGYARWQAGWSQEKKTWCCHHEQKGCQEWYNCWAHGDWTGAQADWCCKNENRGCPPTQAPYDCYNHQGLWSLAQKDYCCRTVRRGCTRPMRLDEEQWHAFGSLPRSRLSWPSSLAAIAAITCPLGLIMLVAARVWARQQLGIARDTHGGSVRPMLRYSEIEEAAEPAIS